MIDSASRVALVTGASRGIGLAVAKRLLLDGTNVFVCARSDEGLKSAHAQLKTVMAAENHARNVRFFTERCDVTDNQAVQRLIQLIDDQFGYLSVLVNNSGGIPGGDANTGAFNDLDENQWLELYRANVVSTVTVCRQSYRLLKQASNSRVINISSVVACQPGLFNPHYAAAKAALLSLSKSLSIQWAKDGILVNAVSPGITATEGWNQYIADKAAATNESLESVARQENQRATQTIAMGRLGSADEIAACVAFLASKASSYTTGVNFIVDGGKYRGI